MPGVKAAAAGFSPHSGPKPKTAAYGSARVRRHDSRRAAAGVDRDGDHPRPHHAHQGGRRDRPAAEWVTGGTTVTDTEF